MKLKVGDIVSYEPSLKWVQAQSMWGSVAVVREAVESYEYDGQIIDCVRVNWLHTPPDPDPAWINMLLTQENCRKIGEVPSASV